MSDDLVNQLTLNFLISKQQLQKLNKKVKETSVQTKIRETKEYSERIKILFNDLLVYQPPDDLLYDVKIAFENFINKSIYYFKAHDNSENLENERSQIIHEDIDYDKEERNIVNGNYKEQSNDSYDEDIEDGYNNDDENEEQYNDYNNNDNNDNENENEVENNHENNDENDNENENDYEEITNNKYIQHNPIIVKSKYKIQSASVGVDDIQKLPLDWFQNVRQNYKKNQIIPRKKEATIEETCFRDVKKKI